MKKNIFATAAIIAACAPALAQTNVQIYGIADAGISRADNGVLKNTTLDSGIQSGSRLGFRGTEDLGGGMSAVFTLENGFAMDSGTLGQGGRLFGRQAFVGLNSGVGSLKLGRQYNPIRTVVDAIDPFNLGLAGNASFVFNVYGDRTDNTINYSTPNLGGFSGQLAYSLGEVAGSNSRGRSIGASAGYTGGPLTVSLAYHDQNLVTATSADNGKARTTLLGGTYDFGIAKAHLAHAWNEGSNAAGADTVDSRDLLVGVTLPFGPHTFLGSYIRRSDKLVGTRDANLYAIGYTYAFSKRTNFYTSYGRVSNDPAATINLGSAVTAGNDPSVFNVGVRHRF
jgi:predicted porin